MLECACSARLADAASVLLKRYERSRALADVNRAVDLSEQAMSLLSEEDPRRSDFLVGFAAATHQRYLSTGTGGDLDQAATLAGWALAGIPAGDPRRPRATMELAGIYATRFARTGVLAGINRAIETGERVITGTTDCRPESLTTLSGSYQQRYTATGSVADLDRAIEVGEGSLNPTAESSFARAGRQAALAAAYWRRFEQQARRRPLTRRMEELIAEIRTLPGFESFASPPGAEASAGNHSPRAGHHGRLSRNDSRSTAMRSMAPEPPRAAPHCPHHPPGPQNRM